MQERLQKYLARCGLGSRRHCEKLIESGAVSIDGIPVTTLGTKVDPNLQKIQVDGITLEVAQLVYYALNKPRGVVCTNQDPAGRPRAVDLVRTKEQHLYSVGRLDEDSEGLLLITNDGDFAQRVAHPRYEVPKVYQVVVKGTPEPVAIEKIRRGVWLAEGKTHPARVEVVRKTRQTTSLLITLKEGRNRHLRRVLAKVELPVKRLQRIRIGPVRLGSLKRGQSRRLTLKEVTALREGRMDLPGESARRPDRARKTGPSTKGRPAHAARATKGSRPAGSQRPQPQEEPRPPQKGGTRKPSGPPRGRSPGARKPQGPDRQQAGPERKHQGPGHKKAGPGRKPHGSDRRDAGSDRRDAGSDRGPRGAGGKRTGSDRAARGAKGRSVGTDRGPRDAGARRAGSERASRRPAARKSGPSRKSR